MAFKMSPIGRNKDPFANMVNRGYIAPTKQSVKISDPEQGQSTVDESAEENIIWDEPGDWRPANDGTGREIRTKTGTGSARGHYVGTKKMGNEKWKEFLKTPKGQEYLADKNRSEVEYRKVVNEPKPKLNSSGTESNIGIQGVEDKVYAGERKQEMEPYQKFVRYEGRGPAAKPIYETAYRPVTKEKILRDYKSTDLVNESDVENMSVEETNKLTTNETSGLSDLNTEYSGNIGTTEGQTLSDQNKIRELELKQIGESMAEQKKTPIYKKYMHKSMANQGCAKSEGGDGCVVKKDGKWVILNNKKGGIWRDNGGKGFANAKAAQKVLSGYHANKG